MKVHELVARFASAADSTDPMKSAREVLELPRRMWNPETLEEHALEWTQYEAFARVASKAAGAPAP